MGVTSSEVREAGLPMVLSHTINVRLFAMANTVTTAWPVANENQAHRMLSFEEVVGRDPPQM